MRGCLEGLLGTSRYGIRTCLMEVGNFEVCFGFDGVMNSMRGR